MGREIEYFQKYQAVQVTRSRKPVKYIYNLSGHVLETVTSAKYAVSVFPVDILILLIICRENKA